MRRRSSCAAAVCLLVAMLSTGCRTSPGDAPALSREEARLQEIYFVLMTSTQVEKYGTLATPGERELYLKVIGVWPRYHDLDESRRKAVYIGTLREGMTPDEATMTLGAPPARRRVIAADGTPRMLWFHVKGDAKRVYRILCFEDDRLTRWRKVAERDYVLLMDKPIEQVMKVFE